jgi:hypothetical protein
MARSAQHSSTTAVSWAASDRTPSASIRVVSRATTACHSGWKPFVPITTLKVIPSPAAMFRAMTR